MWYTLKAMVNFYLIITYESNPVKSTKEEIREKRRK